MIIGVGIDILEKKRIKKIFFKYKKKFEKKILNQNEINNQKNNQKNITHIAKLFSIKEALVKAVGTGFKKNLSFKKINVCNNNLGKPFVKHKDIHTYTSISHEKNIIIAIVLIRIKN